MSRMVSWVRATELLLEWWVGRGSSNLIDNFPGVCTRVVKADFLKAVREAVAQRLIKAVKRLLYVVNKTNDCFKMHLTSVRLWASTFHY